MVCAQVGSVEDLNPAGRIMRKYIGCKSVSIELLTVPPGQECMSTAWQSAANCISEILSLSCLLVSQCLTAWRSASGRPLFTCLFHFLTQLLPAGSNRAEIEICDCGRTHALLHAHCGNARHHHSTVHHACSCAYPHCV